MTRIDQRDELAGIDMGVDLRGRDVGMAEHGLQRAQIRAAFQQMRGEGMAKDVRADPCRIDAGFGGERADQLEQTHPAEM